MPCHARHATVANVAYVNARICNSLRGTRSEDYRHNAVETPFAILHAASPSCEKKKKKKKMGSAKSARQTKGSSSK